MRALPCLFHESTGPGVPSLRSVTSRRATFRSGHFEDSQLGTGTLRSVSNSAPDDSTRTSSENGHDIACSFRRHTRFCWEKNRTSFRLFISRLPGLNFTPSSFKSNSTRLITTDSCRGRRWLRNNPTMLASQAEEDRSWLNPAMQWRV